MINMFINRTCVPKYAGAQAQTLMKMLIIKPVC